jgi:hypothetical protein
MSLDIKKAQKEHDRLEAEVALHGTPVVWSLIAFHRDKLFLEEDIAGQEKLTTGIWKLRSNRIWNSI